MKDDLGLKAAGVYGIPYECGKVYIGQTGRSIEARIKKHRRHNGLYHPNKSAVAEHSTGLGHRIQFQDTRILATKTGCMESIIRGATEIALYPDNMNREGFPLSKP
jgi:hypothetical protein